MAVKDYVYLYIIILAAILLRFIIHWFVHWLYQTTVGETETTTAQVQNHDTVLENNESGTTSATGKDCTTSYQTLLNDIHYRVKLFSMVRSSISKISQQT